MAEDGRRRATNKSNCVDAAIAIRSRTASNHLSFVVTVTKTVTGFPSTRTGR